jgi:precorrin-6B methylase 2
MIQMTLEEQAALIKTLSPWHYCWEFPSGLRTGDSAPNLFPEKMPMMIAGGAFVRPTYPEVLDLGANSGYIAKWFVENKGSHVVAIERGEKFFPQLVHVIEVFGLESRIEARQDGIEECDFGTEGGYDLILFLGTLHHIERRHHARIFKECLYVLKMGGEIVVQTKREEDVPGKLEDADFGNVQQVYWSDEQDRGCWQGTK